MLFILAAGSFSEMFTTYSHALWLPSPAGLRLEIRSESDKKKMNFIFNRKEKIFLTQKMKRACRQKKKQRLPEGFRAAGSAIDHHWPRQAMRHR
jgi:hypothetical protein